MPGETSTATLELPGQSSVQMAGLVSARFRRGMLPLAAGTALCVALSAPLADFLLERHDLAHRGQAYASDLAQQIAAQEAGKSALAEDDARAVLQVIAAALQERGTEDIVRVEVLDARGGEIAALNSREANWPLVWTGAPLAAGASRLGAVRVAIGEPEWIERDLLLLGVFGGLGLVLGLALYFFPLRLFREEDLVLLFARRSVRAAEEERLRLSRDLHDGLGQTLGTAAVALVRLNARLGPSPEAADTARLIDGALDELRHIALGLRPPSLVDLGLGAAVGALARDAERTGLAATVQIEELPPLDPELELTCFRLAQEALSNLVSHAEAKSFRLTLARQGAMLALEVHDDGRGFSPASGMGLGLVGARERASRLAGHFSVESAPGKGTTFRALLPLQVGNP